MLDRIELEEREKKFLSPYACLSAKSKGRQYSETECDIRTIFQRDRDRIIHSKSFRRLKHKTQVFIAPAGDHYRTRLTHTLEVAQIARTIARSLALNEDLVEAIALGHDLGHTPFGHAGEEALDAVARTGFTHNVHSLRVVDIIEKLNLSYEVRDGIRNHTGETMPETLEGQIVRLADRIAYINHDIDDALRAQIIDLSELPAEALSLLGDNHSQRIDTMVRDMITNSWMQDKINYSSGVARATENLRDFLFANVYIGSKAKKEENKARRLVKELYKYYLRHVEQIPVEFKQKETDVEPEQIVIDYVAGMSDRYAINRGGELFMPSPWRENKFI